MRRIILGAFLCFFSSVLFSQSLNAVHAHHHTKKKKIAIAEKVVYQKSVVVIDPGHGGKDPGASGQEGVHEKNVVLAVSQYVQNDLSHYAGIQPVMTRQGDYFVTLRGRLQAARQSHGDVFVAIHADSYLNNRAQGASVFVLSEHGASSEAARWLAKNENDAVLGGAKFNTNNRVVQSVLLNLSQTATIADSFKLGRNVMNQLKQETSLHTGKVEEAPFMVLKSPDIPSILVEIGFISNRHEEKNLKSPAFQAAVASAIAQGIVSYLYKNPPHDSIIENQQAGRLTITTTSKQSLTALAKSYNLSLDKLREANQLIKKNTPRLAAGIVISKTIPAGTVLVIPKA